MGPLRVEKPLAPEPRDACPKCGRPVALSGGPICVYCAAPLRVIQGAGQRPQLPPEVLLAADTRAFRLTPGLRWGLRWAAIVLVGLITWLASSGGCGR
jgi:hypothetical protein